MTRISPYLTPFIVVTLTVAVSACSDSDDSASKGANDGGTSLADATANDSGAAFDGEVIALDAGKNDGAMIPVDASFIAEDAGRFKETAPTCDEDGGSCAELIVKDVKTGLVWQRDYKTDKNWRQATDYCSKLVYAGYDDWIPPRLEQLETLIDDARSEPASDFPGMPSSVFWSGSFYVNYYSDHAWSVDFGDGNAKLKNKTDQYNIRCVRDK